MEKKRIVITGSTGMLGSFLIKILKREEKFDIYGISRNDSKQDGCDKKIALDLTDNTLLKNTIEEIKPDIIVHCAANVNVDDCEINKEYAYNLHVESTRILASYKPTKTKLIYISTDSVFDGNLGNYSENNKVNPLNYYAQTKLYGEEVALENNPNTTVIRTNIYGFHLPKEKSLVEWAIENLEQSNYINGFVDVYFNPVYVGQLGEVIKYICEKENYNGILNVGSYEYISKYEFLKKLARIFNYSEKLISKSSVEKIEFKALRPKNTTLNTDKLKDLYNKNLYLELGLLELKKDFID